ncbi:hypothetical protein M5K25_018099 [Dendrobium thyrsiflorum]|uniref:Uncharacterized protein n=1 Tax=Dendrobium thyrsiflorum TaxID=117978 RepID=A0ABD0UP97_DENTH
MNIYNCAFSTEVYVNLKEVPPVDILVDFLRQRFGVDTYERIETSMIMAKNVASLKKFNNKESGIFAFPIEKHDCLPSVKLLSVDAIILVNSDWNPLNDLRSLRMLRGSINKPRINGYDSGPSEPSGSAAKWHHDIKVMASACMFSNDIKSLRYESIGYNR